MASDETRYTNKVFMAAALPLMKTIATDVPELKKKFEGVNAIYQVSAKVNAEDKEAVHFIIENGEWTVKLGEYLGQEKIDAELAFSSMEKMNAFMKGDMSKLPKMKIKSFGKFIKFMMVLLKMSSLLSITTPPEDDEELSLLLCKLYFYLLSQAFPSLTKWVSLQFTSGQLKALTDAISGRLRAIPNALLICVLRQAKQEQVGANISVQSRFSV